MGLTDTVDQVLESADDNIYSRQEAEADRTARHAADMLSDNKLSKNARPVALYWSMVIITIIVGIECFLVIKETREFNEYILLLIGGLATSAWGFYFTNRRMEKVQAAKAAAAVTIEKQKARDEAKAEKEKTKFSNKILRQIRKGKLTPEQGEDLLNADL